MSVGRLRAERLPLGGCRDGGRRNRPGPAKRMKLLRKDRLHRLHLGLQDRLQSRRRCRGHGRWPRQWRDHRACVGNRHLRWRDLGIRRHRVVQMIRQSTDRRDIGQQLPKPDVDLVAPCNGLADLTQKQAVEPQLQKAVVDLSHANVFARHIRQQRGKFRAETGGAVGMCGRNGGGTDDSHGWRLLRSGGLRRMGFCPLRDLTVIRCLGRIDPAFLTLERIGGKRDLAQAARSLSGPVEIDPRPPQRSCRSRHHVSIGNRSGMIRQRLKNTTVPAAVQGLRGKR